MTKGTRGGTGGSGFSWKSPADKKIRSCAQSGLSSGVSSAKGKTPNLYCSSALPLNKKTALPLPLSMRRNQGALKKLSLQGEKHSAPDSGRKKTNNEGTGDRLTLFKEKKRSDAIRKKDYCTEKSREKTLGGKNWAQGMGADPGKGLLQRKK